MTETSIVPVMEAAIPGTTQPLQQYLPSIAQLSNCPHCTRDIAIRLMYMKAEIEDEKDDGEEIIVSEEEEKYVWIQSPTNQLTADDRSQDFNTIIVSSDDDVSEKAHVACDDFVLHLDEEYSSCESGLEDGDFSPEEGETLRLSESSDIKDAAFIAEDNFNNPCFEAQLTNAVQVKSEVVADQPVITMQNRPHAKQSSAGVECSDTKVPCNAPDIVNGSKSLALNSSSIPCFEARPSNPCQVKSEVLTDQPGAIGDQPHASQSSPSVEYSDTWVPCSPPDIINGSESLALNTLADTSAPSFSKNNHSAMGVSPEGCHENEPKSVSPSAKDKMGGQFGEDRPMLDDCLCYTEDEADSSSESSGEEWSQKGKVSQKSHFQCQQCKKSFSSRYFLMRHKNTKQCTSVKAKSKPKTAMSPAKKLQPGISTDVQPKRTVVPPPEVLSKKSLPRAIPISRIHIPRIVRSGHVVVLDISSSVGKKVVGFSCFLCKEILSTHPGLVQHLKFQHQYQFPTLQNGTAQESIQINLNLNISGGAHPTLPLSERYSKISNPTRLVCPPPELLQQASPSSSESCKTALRQEISPLYGLKVSSRPRAKYYVCHICNRACISNHHLTIHMRAHTGSRPYKCNHCGKGFVCQGVLSRHFNFCKLK